MSFAYSRPMHLSISPEKYCYSRRQCQQYLIHWREVRLHLDIFVLRKYTIFCSVCKRYATFTNVLGSTKCWCTKMCVLSQQSNIQTQDRDVYFVNIQVLKNSCCIHTPKNYVKTRVLSDMLAFRTTVSSENRHIISTQNNKYWGSWHMFLKKYPRQILMFKTCVLYYNKQKQKKKYLYIYIYINQLLFQFKRRSLGIIQIMK